ncbi:hypothetical protein M3Y96_00519800 [Aphelenchoides besseyi]|nr:hypothetical protein M3Y96_00519800 [Aphelenchoides besseyi]
MLRLLLFGLMFGMNVQSLNKCIEKINRTDMRGFMFKDCSGPAEVAFKWKNKHELKLALNLDLAIDAVRTFQLIINDKCSLTFNGYEPSYGTWTTEDGKVINATFLEVGGLYITNADNLILENGQEIDCGGKILRNEIDNDWVWSKFRLYDLPKTYSYYILINGHVDEGEGEEYNPLETTIETIISTFAIEESNSSVEETTSTTQKKTSSFEKTTTILATEVEAKSKFKRSDDSADMIFAILRCVGKIFTLLVKLLLSFLSYALYGQ